MGYLDRYKNKEKRLEWNREYHRRYMREYYAKRKRENNPMPSQTKEYIAEIRDAAISKIGGYECCECGCNIKKILEINHIRGGGREERRHLSSKAIYRKIMNHPSPIDDYNVLCRICNAVHYVRDILEIKGHKVSWESSLTAKTGRS